jgi:hypothetical protein
MPHLDRKIVKTMQVVTPPTSGGLVSRPPTPVETPEQQLKRRVEGLLAAGWELTEGGEGWRLDTSDPRWQTTSHEEAVGGNFEDNTNGAWGIQLLRRGEAARRGDRCRDGGQ